MVSKAAPQGTRKWRGTKAKLTSWLGTHTLHSAFRLSQISSWYFSHCAAWSPASVLHSWLAGSSCVKHTNVRCYRHDRTVAQGGTGLRMVCNAVQALTA